MSGRPAILVTGGAGYIGLALLPGAGHGGLSARHLLTISRPATAASLQARLWLATSRTRPR